MTIKNRELFRCNQLVDSLGFSSEGSFSPKREETRAWRANKITDMPSLIHILLIVIISSDSLTSIANIALSPTKSKSEEG